MITNFLQTAMDGCAYHGIVPYATEELIDQFVYF